MLQRQEGSGLGTENSEGRDDLPSTEGFSLCAISSKREFAKVDSPVPVILLETLYLHLFTHLTSRCRGSKVSIEYCSRCCSSSSSTQKKIPFCNNTKSIRQRVRPGTLLPNSTPYSRR